jgi:hypothetical protein
LITSAGFLAVECERAEIRNLIRLAIFWGYSRKEVWGKTLQCNLKGIR